MKAVLLAVLVFALLVTGCSHRPAKLAVPSVPPTATESGPTVIANSPELEIPADAKPLLVETGIASWYGAPYHNRRASNGEIYDMHAMTAAHRTLPLGSIVRVTNLDSKQSAIVRITDRGPFIEGRVVDLSEAAAKKIGMLQKGTTKVEIEVLKTPVPLSDGGRWAVQIGGFDHVKAAREVAELLALRYHTANVVTFTLPGGAWCVRVRVKDELRSRAEEVERAT
jgi:rare lipoprotein A